jgi:hypothetical protein
MIQIDGPQRHVYIKFSDPHRMQEILTATQGQADFRHGNGEISKVRIEAVGLGMRRVRVGNLPPAVADRTLRMYVGKYGEVHDIHAETWSNIYRNQVASFIRVVVMTLVQHIPSQWWWPDTETWYYMRGSLQLATVITNRATCTQRAPQETEEGRHAETTPWAEVVPKWPALAHPTTLDKETDYCKRKNGHGATACNR